jgi:hypothetical protein
LFGFVPSVYGTALTAENIYSWMRNNGITFMMKQRVMLVLLVVSFSVLSLHSIKKKTRKSIRSLTESSRIAGGTRGRYLSNAVKNSFTKIGILFSLRHSRDFPRFI